MTGRSNLAANASTDWKFYIVNNVVEVFWASGVFLYFVVFDRPKLNASEVSTRVSCYECAVLRAALYDGHNSREEIKIFSGSGVVSVVQSYVKKMSADDHVSLVSAGVVTSNFPSRWKVEVYFFAEDWIG